MQGFPALNFPHDLIQNCSMVDSCCRNIATKLRATCVQQQRGPRQRPGAAAAGQPEREGLPGAGRRDAPVRAHHDQRQGAGADQEPLDAAVPDHEPEEPIAGNTGNVVCNTSFTDLSDSRVKTEMAEADVAELQQLFDSVEAKQYKRPDMNGDLRLGFASDDFAGTKWKNLTGTTRWSDGTEMVTLDYSHLTSVLWGVCKGFQARLDEVEAWQAQRGPKNKSCACLPASREPCSSSFLGQQVGVFQASLHPGTLETGLFWGKK